MSVIVDIINAIIDFYDAVVAFFEKGIYDIFSQWTAWSTEWWVVAMWKAKLAALSFSWDVAQNIIVDLNLSTYVNQAWSSLDSRVLSMFVFFRIPEAVNLLISAGVTKFVFKFLGF